ncbi:hypothetical protein Vqi01_57460 [Micromonospora qiuiae]|uniref:Bacterial bifunctional deaminase-reductase C-terminal domain-containing protein n=1 Tax=Micromonospora qiuiae TaxID=502268 RepID=A0ABQ4JM59_9ACTN|nr:hypothetical protein Vqi01_57460 [Micromonospora qiuiae]
MLDVLMPVDCSVVGGLGLFSDAIECIPDDAETLTITGKVQCGLTVQADEQRADGFRLNDRTARDRRLNRVGMFT